MSRWKTSTDPKDHPDPLEDWCRLCGIHMGYGFIDFHLEVCENCHDTLATEEGE